MVTVLLVVLTRMLVSSHDQVISALETTLPPDENSQATPGDVCSVSYGLTNTTGRCMGKTGRYHSKGLWTPSDPRSSLDRKSGVADPLPGGEGGGGGGGGGKEMPSPFLFVLLPDLRQRSIRV